MKQRIVMNMAVIIRNLLGMKANKGYQTIYKRELGERMTVKKEEEVDYKITVKKEENI